MQVRKKYVRGGKDVVTDQPPEISGVGLSVVRLSDVEPESVSWLWANRIPVGKLSLVGGVQGRGKSFLMCDMAARISKGTAWPDRSHCSVGSTIMLSAEDGLADTIRPRLDAHGADVRKVFAIRAAANGERSFDLQQDLPALQSLIQEVGDVRLVVVDPLDSYLGEKLDSHRNNEVRRVLQPLADLAERTQVAVVGIGHLTKSPNPKALYRFCGSIAFTAAARSVWFVCDDRGNPDVRLLLNGKMNVGKPAPGIAYTIEDGRVCWMDGTVDTTADEALGEPEQTPPSAKQNATAFLREMLADGEADVADVKAEAARRGIAWVTVDRARSAAGVHSYRLQGVKETVWRMRLNAA